MSTFTNVSMDEYKKAASEFFRATMDRTALNKDEVENGHKALTLLYFGHDRHWTEQEIYEACVILKLAGTRCVEVLHANKYKGNTYYEE